SLNHQGDTSTDRRTGFEYGRTSARWATPGLWANVAENLLGGAERERDNPNRTHQSLEGTLPNVLAKGIAFLSLAARYCSRRDSAPELSDSWWITSSSLHRGLRPLRRR